MCVVCVWCGWAGMLPFCITDRHFSCTVLSHSHTHTQVMSRLSLVGAVWYVNSSVPAQVRRFVFLWASQQAEELCITLTMDTDTHFTTSSHTAITLYKQRGAEKQATYAEIKERASDFLQKKIFPGFLKEVRIKYCCHPPKRQDKLKIMVWIICLLIKIPTDWVNSVEIVLNLKYWGQSPVLNWHMLSFEVK